MTYVVRLFPGVKGLVHLCYMLGHYHSAETFSKDWLWLSAPRPGGRNREISDKLTTHSHCPWCSQTQMGQTTGYDLVFYIFCLFLQEDTHPTKWPHRVSVSWKDTGRIILRYISGKITFHPGKWQIFFFFFFFWVLPQVKKFNHLRFWFSLLFCIKNIKLKGIESAALDTVVFCKIKLQEKLKHECNI